MTHNIYSMPSNVFANTGTNVSVVFFDNSKQSENVILIDASKLGEEYQEGNIKPEDADWWVDDVFENGESYREINEG